MDKSVTEISFQEVYSGSSLPCGAPPLFLINDETDPLTLHTALRLPEASVGVRKETISFHMWRGGNGQRRQTKNRKRVKAFRIVAEQVMRL